MATQVDILVRQDEVLVATQKGFEEAKVIPLDKSKSTEIFTEPSVFSTGDHQAGYQEILNQLKDRISLLEQLKYPDGHYEARKFQINLDNDGNKSNVIYVKSIPGFPLTKQDHYHITNLVLLIRKLTFLAGAANLLADQKIKDHVDFKEINKDKLLELINNAIYEFQAIEKEIDIYNAEPNFSGLIIPGYIEKFFTKNFNKGDIKILYKAEKYFLADFNANRILVNEYDVKIKGKDKATTCIELDLPFGNKLTDELKAEFLAIHNTPIDQPIWFQNMEEWEQEWLKQYVPDATKDNDEGWLKFESIFQTSALQNMPGLKNARMSYLLHQDNKDKPARLISRLAKTASHSPYETGHNSEQAMANLTSDQLIQRMAPLARDSSQTLWGDPNEAVISITSLMTTKKGLDKKLNKVQEKSIASVKRNDVKIIAGIESTNNFRRVPFSNNSNFSDQIIAQAKKLSERPNRPPNTEKNIKLMLACEEAIKAIPPRTLSDRNRVAYRSAYIAILTEAMGGIPVIGCKSGKDRTNYDSLLIFSMKTQYELTGKLPQYKDSDEESEDFLNIFDASYNSQHSQESAAANSGSAGLKDNRYSGVLCGDKREKLGVAYKQTHVRAKFNKAGSLGNIESQTHKDLCRKDLEKVVSQFLLPSKKQTDMQDQVKGLQHAREKIETTIYKDNEKIKEIIEKIKAIELTNAQKKDQIYANKNAYYAFNKKIDALTESSKKFVDKKEYSDFALRNAYLKFLKAQIPLVLNDINARSKIIDDLFETTTKTSTQVDVDLKVIVRTDVIPGSDKLKDLLTNCIPENCIFNQNELDRIKYIYLSEPKFQKEIIEKAKSFYPEQTATKTKITDEKEKQKYHQLFTHGSKPKAEALMSTPSTPPSSLANHSGYTYSLYKGSNGVDYVAQESPTSYQIAVHKLEKKFDRKEIIKSVIPTVKGDEIAKIEAAIQEYLKAVISQVGIREKIAVLNGLFPGHPEIARSLIDKFEKSYFHDDYDDFIIPNSNILNNAEFYVNEFLKKRKYANRNPIVYPGMDHMTTMAIILVFRAKNISIEDKSLLGYKPEPEEITAVREHLNKKTIEIVKTQVLTIEETTELNQMNIKNPDDNKKRLLAAMKTYTDSPSSILVPPSPSPLSGGGPSSKL